MDKREIRTHMSHCFQGEYELTCKYGDANCPAKKEIEDMQEKVADIFFKKMSKLTKLELRRKIEMLFNEIKDLKHENKKLLFALSEQGDGGSK